MGRGMWCISCGKIQKKQNKNKNKYINVDTTKINHISLCSGYGGIDLGLRRVLPGLRTVAYAEIEAFACEVLLARMEGGQLDAAPIWSDLKSFPWKEFSGLVDILSGGYPCQPFSSAGKRLGADDERHLWPFIADGIAIMRPRVCFFENVEGHITLGLSTVISDLEELGYKVSWGIFSASEVGAPHQRKRVFIMAERGSIGGKARFSRSIAWEKGITGVAHDCGSEVWPSRPRQPQHAWEPPRVVDSSSTRANSRQQFYYADGRSGEALLGEFDATSEPPRVVGDTNGSEPRARRGNDGSTEPNRSGTNERMEPQQWQTEPTLGGDVDGIADRLDNAKLHTTCDNRTEELRLLGNGVVPATAAKAFMTLLNEIHIR